jgi:SAM-dependent methyltransferase
MNSEPNEASAQARTSKLSADPIRDFYTSYPFPPPLENLERALEIYKDENVRRAEFHVLWPGSAYRTDLDVLVAGCGTWQSAKYALCHADSRVVAIDVSPTSIEHTERLKQKYNLTNLEVRQMRLEEVADLDREFDYVICTGVLHHLADPDAGLRALRSVLRRDGAMYLMVYAPYGRTGVYMMQEYCRMLGVGKSDEEMRDLIAALRMLPQHHPLIATQGGSREFQISEALIDALLNPRDRAYSVPQLFDLLDGSELTLGRWYWQAAYLPQCGFIARTPHGERLAALPEREQYAAMELWRGWMSNHSVVVHRNDADRDRSKVRFDDDGEYLRYVPVRMPSTRLVEQSLPPGAAGVLVNQTHVFSDLYLIINPLEKQIFEAIDGQRTVTEVVESVNEDPAMADVREFFEKLWLHDQVVFDISKAG